MAEIALAPEVITHVGNFKITNTLIATAVVDAVLISFVFVVKSQIKEIPGKIQSIAESIIETFYDMTYQIAGKFTNSIFPWFASFFLFIFATNFIGLFKFN